MTLPLVLAAVLPLVLIPGGQRNAVAVVVNVAAWLVFVADLLVHRRFVVRYLSTWVGRFDLTVVILTAPWFLVFGSGGGTIVLLIRFARIGRLVLAGPDARRLVKRIGRVGIVAIGVVVLGAVAAYEAEHPSNPQFASFGDSLWWSIVTLTTVGYGDIVPITTEGRLVGVMIMVVGVGVLGVLAGSLASFFRLAPDTTLSAPDDEGHAEALRREVLDLKSQVERLNDGIGRLLVQDSPPGGSST
jgi:voltage-gated potassium channel